LSQPDKSQSSTSRRLKRARGPEPKSRASEEPVQRPAVPSPAADSRPDLHALNRKVAEMTFKLGGLEEQLKKSREAQAKADAAAAAADRRAQDVTFKASRVPALEMEIAALRPQLEEARRRVKEMQSDIKKARQERDQLQADLEKGGIRAGELERRVQTLSTSVSRVATLEQELEKLRLRLEETSRALEMARQQASTSAAEHGRQMEAAAEQTAKAQRFQESLEEELVEAQEAEAKSRDEASTSKASEERLNSQVARLEALRQEQQQSLDRLGRKVRDLEERLAKAESVAPVPPPTVPIPTPAAREGDLPPEPPAPVIVSPLPAPIPVPSIPAAPAVHDGPPTGETAHRPQNLFGPDGEDGKPRYMLEDILFKDDLGIVYRATERATDRKFMVRFMAGQAGEEQTQAIERGVEKLIALPHPNILHIQGSGRRKNRLYLMMDLVDGPTLGQCKIQEIQRICAILRDTATAVHYANEEGIFHGDLNPENVLVTQREGLDHALVKEFGLGFLQEIMAPPTSGKEATPILRNPAFLPPEQVRATKSPLSAAGDVYGLGATLYTAMSGRPPFEGKDPVKVAKRVMIEEPLPVEKARPDVPEAVGAVIRRAMAKERGLRYGSAQEMADALTRFLDASKS
jgi:hypothetical protein